MTEASEGRGLAAPRTALAWQRTALSLGAASAIIARLTWSSLGLFAVATLAVVLVLSGWVFLESRRRYRHDSGAGATPRLRGGRAPLALALSAALVAATEVAALLST